MKMNEANVSTTQFSIYQINSDRDATEAMFLNSNGVIKIHGVLEVDSGSYDRVYSGTMAVNNLEDIHYVFNMDHPNDFRGRNLSVSDVVEILDSPHIDPGFYFCDRFGFKKNPL